MSRATRLPWLPFSPYGGTRSPLPPPPAPEGQEGGGEHPQPPLADRLPIPPEQRPAALALTLAGLGIFQMTVGLGGLAVLSLGFAALWIGAQAQGRLDLARSRSWLR